ncbi:MAG: hypothetical protein GX837_07595 [Methanomicrobiales archaeon]|nr:hypothetical protein [Methanomicrobiales archaeon]
MSAPGSSRGSRGCDIEPLVTFESNKDYVDGEQLDLVPNNRACVRIQEIPD